MSRGTYRPKPRVNTVGSALASETWRRVILFIVILALCLAPAPFGSVRPAMYLSWTTLFAMLLLALSIFGPAPRRLGIAVPAVLFGGAMGWVILQLLPLGDLIGYAPLVRGEPLPQVHISGSTGETLLLLIRQFGYAALFVLVVQCTPRNDDRLLVLRWLGFAALAYAIFGMLSLRVFGDTIWGLPKGDHLGSVTGPFANRNTFATYLAIGLCINIALCLRSWNRADDDQPIWRNGDFWMHALAVLLIAAALFMTNSRMGLLVSVVGAIAILLLRARVVGGTGRQVLVGLALAGVAGTGLFAIYGSQTWDRITTAGTDLDLRLVIFEHALHLIRERPWAGWGAGAFQQALPAIRDTTLLTDTIINKAHNSYLNLAAELGIPAAAALVLALLAITTRLALHYIRHRATTPLAVALATVVIVGVHATMDYSLEIPAVTMLFVALMAMGYSEAINGRTSGASG